MEVECADKIIFCLEGLIYGNYTEFVNLRVGTSILIARFPDRRCRIGRLITLILLPFL